MNTSQDPNDLPSQPKTRQELIDSLYFKDIPISFFDNLSMKFLASATKQSVRELYHPPPPPPNSYPKQDAPSRRFIPQTLPRYKDKPCSIHNYSYTHTNLNCYDQQDMECQLHSGHRQSDCRTLNPHFIPIFPQNHQNPLHPLPDPALTGLPHSVVDSLVLIQDVLRNLNP